ncbi:MAG: LapA family protein [Betaproteobacteria bacterium]
MLTGVLIVFIVAMVTVLSVQNTVPVIVSFLYWRFETSLSFVIFFTVLFGVLLSQLLRNWMSKRSRG